MRLFYILLSVIFGCTTCNDNNLPPQNKSVVELNGQLSVQGTHLINTQGDTVMLKGVSYGWHNWWRRFYNDTSVTTFSTDWHCSVVRAAMGIEPDNAYLKNPDFAIKCVTKIVDSAIKNGIYVIIDWHSHHIKTQEAVAFFEKRLKLTPSFVTVAPIGAAFPFFSTNSWLSMHLICMPDHLDVTGTFQTFSQYSRMERSEEK